jgi:peptide/nickel transport system ATP-binding protein
VNESGQELLRVEELETEFESPDGTVHAVRGNSFVLHRGETLGVVGESGSGKSVTVRSLLRIIRHPGRIVGGRVLFDGVDLLALTEREMNRYRGSQISMIFQEPSAALNPVLTVGEQIAEALTLHRGFTKHQAWARAIDQLREVGIPAPEDRVKSYPHQLSGGMQQRCVIAIALACNPKLLIADEPTTSLDVTVQAQILRLLIDLTKQHDVGLIFITHDIAVVAQMADRIMVMYGGRIMEEGTVEQVTDSPQHPYTVELLKAMPKLSASRGERLVEIAGEVPSLVSPPAGCPFHPRCSKVMEICTTDPTLAETEAGRRVACWLYQDH